MRKPSATFLIALPLVAAIVSWGLFLGAQYSDLVLAAQQPTMYDPETPEVVRPSIWLAFAAVALFGLGSLVAQRRAIVARATFGPEHELARAAHRFTNLAVILALAVAAASGISVFLSGFIVRASENSTVLVRIANAYAPIVLYTALVVVLLLGAFVFRRAAVPAAVPVPSDDSVDPPAGAGHPTTPGPTRLTARSALGLAYATPIVLAAVALIIGLIVYDVTGTAPEVWVWVIIQALIGAGIVAGTVLARRAEASSAAAPSASGPASAAATPAPVSLAAIRGAHRLNFVLSIVFGVVVTLMSFGYGATAINRLGVAPSLWVEAYPSGEMNADGEIIATDGLTVTASGYNLSRGSRVVVTFQPGGEEVLSGTVDRDSSFTGQEEIAGLDGGDYTVTAVGTAADKRQVTATMSFTIAENGAFEVDGKGPMPEGEPLRIAPPTADWVLNDFLPALLLIVLACAGVFTTLVTRNREVGAAGELDDRTEAAPQAV